MYKVFEDMVDTLKENQKFDLRDHLRNRDRGMRLAGYAYLGANPDQPWTPDLVDAVLHEDAPFNEEMGLKALRHALQGHCGRLDDNLRTELKARAEKYRERAHNKGRESKRAGEIDAIFEQCPE
jgi:hypothetical protein